MKLGFFSPILKVEPEIHVHTQRVEQILGQEARFECRIKANPLVNFYWMKNDRVIESVDNSILMNNAESPGVHILTNSLSSDSVSRKSLKYETIVYNNHHNHEYLTVVSLVIKVRK